MSQRTFKAFTIISGGTPQPLIGTRLTANAGPAATNNTIKIAVADSSMFQKGDWALLQSVDGTTRPGARHKVFSVPDSTHIVLNSLEQAYVGGAFGTGDWVILANLVNSVYVQTVDGNAAALFLGTTGMNTTGSVNVIAKLENVSSGTQPVDFENDRNVGANPESLGQYFIDGTTSDSYVPSVGVI
jgi:hypothetical protein